MSSLNQWLLPFYSLSYRTEPPKNPDSFPNSFYYDTGLLDICFIVTCIAVMAVLRDFIRLVLLEPFAARMLDGNSDVKKIGNGKVNGHVDLAKEKRKIRRSVLRFAEQGWPAIYYPIQWSFGLYINKSLPSDLWKDYPHIPLPGPLKLYYLTETAFYLHQLLILNAEARRKDHWQMMVHHIITIFLMGASYSYNFTRVGCLIMVLMDWCDIFLPIAKMLRYLKMPQIYSDGVFAVFVVSWMITRHGLFLRVIFSTIFDAPKIESFKWDPSTGSYLTHGSHIMFCSSLLALQALQLLWSATILRIVWRAITTKQGAEDDRSDESADEKDE